MVAGSSQAPAEKAAARKMEPPSGFGQAAQPTDSRPPARPRMNSVNVSGPLQLPDGCDTHFFLVSTKSTNESFVRLPLHSEEPLPGDRLRSGGDAGAGTAAFGFLLLARQQGRGSDQSGESSAHSSLLSSFDCRVVHAGDARGRRKDQLLPALPKQGGDGPALRAGAHSHLAQVSDSTSYSLSCAPPSSSARRLCSCTVSDGIACGAVLSSFTKSACRDRGRPRPL